MLPLMLDREHHSNIRRRLSATSLASSGHSMWGSGQGRHLSGRSGPLRGNFGAAAADLSPLPRESSGGRGGGWLRVVAKSPWHQNLLCRTRPLHSSLPSASVLQRQKCFFSSSKVESEQRLLLFIFTSYVCTYTLLHPFFDISSQHKVSHCLSEW